MDQICVCGPMPMGMGMLRVNDGSSLNPLTIKSPSIFVLLGISMGSFVALGLARLAYSLLVPTIREEIGWSYETIGWIGTTMTTGYLVGALVAPLIVSRIGSRETYGLGFVLTTIGLFATGFTTNLAAVLVLRFVCGFSTALIFVIGSTLIAASSPTPSRARLGMTLYLGCGGLGMVLTATTIPFIADVAGWIGGWSAIGAFAALAAVITLPATLAAKTPPAQVAFGFNGIWIKPSDFLWPTCVSYTLFGAGYLAFATFVVAYLRFRLNFSSYEIAFYWGICGFAGMVSSFAWLPILARVSGGNGIAILNLCSASGAALVLIAHSRTAAFMSAALFGLSFLMVAAAVLNFARRSTHPSDLTRTVSLLTVCFSIGQCVGPTVAGIVADRGYGIEGGIGGAIFLLLLATLSAWKQREPSLAT